MICHKSYKTLVYPVIPHYFNNVPNAVGSVVVSARNFRSPWPAQQRKAIMGKSRFLWRTRARAWVTLFLKINHQTGFWHELYVYPADYSIRLHWSDLQSNSKYLCPVHPQPLLSPLPVRWGERGLRRGRGESLSLLYGGDKDWWKVTCPNIDSLTCHLDLIIHFDFNMRRPLIM